MEQLSNANTLSLRFLNMKKTAVIKSISLFFLSILFILKIAVLSGCANIIPPTGGPRDSLPPILLKVTPPDSSKGFNAKTITFTFDEYILQPDNLADNLIITPTPAIMPLIESRLKTLTVRIKDTLEPNTTYYYNFGKSIKDVNESNILENFSYIFTTGDTFDTLQLAGKVILAETGGIDTTMIVMLHRSEEDSAVIKERPRYIAKLDGKGNFRFVFLPAGRFYLYALKDETGSRRYYNTESLFAFADSAVEIKPDVPPATLYAYATKKQQQAPTVSFAGGNRAGGARADDKRLKYTTTVSAGSQDLLTDFSINFDQPLKNIDTTKIHLSTDSSFVPITASWQMDSLNKKLSMKIAWQEGTLYNLLLEQDFAEDSVGRMLLKPDTVRFTTKRLADYGSVRVTIGNLDLSKSPVLQFSQSERVVKAFPLTSTEFYKQLFFPGEYSLSILYDDNKNGVWDPGDFFGARKQPELVVPLEKKITIRADWENEFEIKL